MTKQREFRPQISAVLPAYNEEEIIEESVLRVAAVLEALTDSYEIVVVNDGSGDRTGAVLSRIQLERPSAHLRVVTHARNQGYGAALASGFDAARGDIVFMTDGDKQFDVAELVHLLPALDDETDLVIGWRRHRADPPVRLLNAWLWKQLINLLFGYTARDVDCAFKLFRRAVWQKITVESRGATFSTEFLIKARRRGFRVAERPVTHYPRETGPSTGAKSPITFQALRDMIYLRRSVNRQLRR
ncbi:MAG TPA: glycosyltransferase family 2 protein, partial [Chloroflexota bacterium]|nr:glycosyltransferase family 2 protein [Chloroflexota bacterium]